MKFKAILLSMLCVSCFLLSVVTNAAELNQPNQPSQSNQQGSLMVRVTGISGDQGSIRIALFNSKQAYEYQVDLPQLLFVEPFYLFAIGKLLGK